MASVPFLPRPATASVSEWCEPFTRLNPAALKIDSWKGRCRKRKMGWAATARGGILSRRSNGRSLNHTPTSVKQGIWLQFPFFRGQLQLLCQNGAHL